MNRRIVIWSIVGLMALVLCFVGSRAVVKRNRARLLADTREAFERRRYSQSLELARQVLEHSPDSAEALRIAGQSAIQLGELDVAETFIDRLVDHPDHETAAAQGAVGDLRLAQFRLLEAEEAFRSALELDNYFIHARQRLVRLLDIEGRSRESAPYRFALMRGGKFDRQDLFFLAQPNSQLGPEEIEPFEKAAPEDPLVQFVKVGPMIQQGQLEEAERLLERVIERAPHHLAAHTALGKLLVQRNAPREEFAKWRQRLPAQAKKYSDLWSVTGQWLLDQNDRRGAARCFWEALRLDANQRQACFQLAHLLAAEGKAEQATSFVGRGEQLQVLMDVMESLENDPQDPIQLRRGAEQLEALGRWHEANAWYRSIALQTVYPWTNRGLLRTAQQMETAGALPTAEEHNPALQIDLSDFPLPEFATEAPSANSTALRNNSSNDQPSFVAFQDVAKEAGIQFQYFNSEDLATPGRRMFEFTGGGAAVLDYDNDGWPDLYLTQGCRWPPQPGQTEHTDRLFRNLGAGKFEDVTQAANLGDNRYSQGAAVGDINNDGLPDLLVANIGGNRLYRNEGDGRFEEITETAGLNGERWTTSCLIADLNGDAWPDIYEANYLQGERVFELICTHGQYRASCTPLAFDAQPDRFFLNTGDGRFTEVSQNAGITNKAGRGLGLLAADFEGAGQLSLFVANDMTANFFFVNRRPRGQPPRFADEAVIAGIAFDRQGRAQACMGVAAGDANGDGLLDLHVTNFFEETNNLYQGASNRFFSDEIRATGLASPSLKMLGFGTQFLDGELDGLPDLIVANGHIDDFTYEGATHQMRPQYFRNLGGTFVEERGERLGEYFQREILGRGLALIDFNRDGKEDAVVSHLDVPAALLMNKTSSVGNYLAIQLCGVNCERDAHGAIVTVTSPDSTAKTTKKWVRQLTAGSGYHASNEKQLIFGLGDTKQPLRIEIQWPTGARQTFDDIKVNQRILLIEGAAGVLRPEL